MSLKNEPAVIIGAITAFAIVLAGGDIAVGDGGDMIEKPAPQPRFLLRRR